jgi:hypothetical protein
VQIYRLPTGQPDEKNAKKEGYKHQEGNKGKLGSKAGHASSTFQLCIAPSLYSFQPSLSSGSSRTNVLFLIFLSGNNIGGHVCVIRRIDQ